ncbi:MAG: hypothetical protein RIT28_937 [Pseudomonadota bacterium]
MIRPPLAAFVVFLALGASAPALVHAVGGACWVWLPAHVPALLGGLAFGPGVGAVAALGTAVSDQLLGGGEVGWGLVPIAAEILSYGLVGGLLGRRAGSRAGLFGALVGAMLAGRLVYAVAATVLGREVSGLVNGLFVTPWPGIVLQLVLLAPLAAGLRDGVARRGAAPPPRG